MARTSLTPHQPTTIIPTSGSTLTFTAADVANGNQFTPSGRDLIIAYNSHATTSYNWTLTSYPYRGRSGDVGPESIAAGAFKYVVIGTPGWKQTDGKIYLSGENAAIKFAVVDLTRAR